MGLRSSDDWGQFFCLGELDLAERSFANGAAVAFGLMGMAEAIRDFDRCEVCGYRGGTHDATYDPDRGHLPYPYVHRANPDRRPAAGSK